MRARKRFTLKGHAIHVRNISGARYLVVTGRPSSESLATIKRQLNSLEPYTIFLKTPGLAERQ